MTHRAAEETGLKEGTPVITGSGDSAAEAVSTGVLSPGDLMVQFGSSLFFYCCTDRLILDDRVRGNNFLVPGTCSIAAGTNNGGTLQNWYRDQLFPECVEKEKLTGENAFSLMMEGLDKIEPGCGGYAGKSHVNPAVLLGDKEKMDGFKRTIADSGLTISALSCMVIPFTRIGELQLPMTRICGTRYAFVKNLDWIRLPAFPDVPETVRIQNTPIVTCPWPDDYLKILDYQWNEVLIPYWREFAALQKRMA